MSKSRGKVHHAEIALGVTLRNDTTCNPLVRRLSKTKATWDWNKVTCLNCLKKRTCK